MKHYFLSEDDAKPKVEEEITQDTGGDGTDEDGEV